MLITTLTFLNPIIEVNDNLCVYEDNESYYYNVVYNKSDTDEKICEYLNKCLDDLDCTKIFNGQYLIKTSYFKYQDRITKYYKMLIKLMNHITYNKYLDKLLNRHIDNLVYEYNHPEGIKIKVKTKNKKVAINKYFKKESIDLFTNKPTYYYENPKTGDCIKSDNPNLLETLNAKKTKAKKKFIKVSSVVPMSAMTFNFKKKD